MLYTDIILLICAIVTTVVTTTHFWLLLRARKRKIVIYSRLNIKGEKVSAIVECLNSGQRLAGINSIRFPLSVWSKEPRLKVNRILKANRLFKILVYGDQHFVSDDVLNSEKTLPILLNEDESISIRIDLDKMMETYFSHNGSLENRIIFGLFILFLNIHVQLANGKIVKKRAHWEIRYYL